MKNINNVLLILVLISLMGCASYIAKEITSPQPNTISGDISSAINKRIICANKVDCIPVQTINKMEKLDISFALELNGNEKAWHYKLINTKIKKTDNTQDELIVIFTGYGQPSNILFLHQHWLQHITGFEVLVVHSADKSKQFKFGLDFVNPIVAEIKRRAPKKVHVIGFSMGAVAATAVSEHIANAQLHLIAPMTNFSDSTKALWQHLYSKKLYAKLISNDVIEEAIEIIYESAGISSKELNIIDKVQKKSIPTYLYISAEDNVVSASEWKRARTEALVKKHYSKLSHLEMVALMDTVLMSDIASNILDVKIDKNNVDTIGVICAPTDEECVEKLEY